MGFSKQLKLQGLESYPDSLWHQWIGSEAKQELFKIQLTQLEYASLLVFLNQFVIVNMMSQRRNYGDVIIEPESLCREEQVGVNGWVDESLPFVS